MPDDYESHELEPFLDSAYLLGEDFTTLAMIDQFREFVWTERYIGYGDFELVLPVTVEFAKEVRLNRYLSIKESPTIMVITSLTVTTSAEEGDTMIVRGRSLETFLERRIIWTKYECNKDKSLVDSIKTLLEQNAIKPTDPKRTIPKLTFKQPADKAITDLTTPFSEEYSNLYEVIKGACEERDLGFRINSDLDSGTMEFELYFGKDRSWDQTENSIVLFSDSYENLISSEYVQNEENYITTALVKADGGSSGLAEIGRIPEKTGLARREGYFTISYDERELRTRDSVIEKVKEAMKENGVTKGFDGEVDPYRQFIFNKDYFVGDIVQLENRYGFSGKCRVTEVVRSRDDRGPIMTPTFIMIEDESVEETKGGA